MSDHAAVPIVGIGASAGGIEALQGFFTHMPAGSGAGFVVVLHLRPDRDSLLAEVLARSTKMPVREAVDGDRVEAEHVYVIPPNHTLKIAGGRLQVGPRTGAAGTNPPIDIFFSSLAAEQGEHAIGVVLSGIGTDGSLGLKAIKECGGVTLAQGSGGTAPQYGAMPAAAIATGAVDLVLSAEDMPERIRDILRQRGPPGATQADGAAAPEVRDIRLEICDILRAQVGHDFSQYKEATFLRRVTRRMQIVGRSRSDYVGYLRRHPGEAVLLFRDLLIGVTSFFRDTATFQAVASTVLPDLFARKGPDDHLRIWVPGCATGEEAYSLAIMLREHVGGRGGAQRIQIFATDIDDPAIGIARAGRYPSILLRGMPPERLERFFTRSEDSYEVSKDLRALCTFSNHSVLRDPPFSRIDLISCRNLLIYLDAEAQTRVIPAFHFSLVPGGFLLLGGSENVARDGDLFRTVDRQHRIFRRIDRPSPPLEVSSMASASRTMREARGDLDAGRSKAVQFANARIRDRFLPAYALVNQAGDAIHYSPRTGKYLELAEGAPTRNLLAQARHGLRGELRTALRKAIETGRAVEQERVAVDFENGVQSITLTVEPVPDTGESRQFLVVFTDEGRPRSRGEAAPEERASVSRDAMLERMDAELRDSMAQNQSASEEYETALEELQSSNEELHSLNEELQSSNEELETAKEELQSVNEELQTVNAELAGKVEALDTANSDMRNLFESTQVATIFLDRNLIIRQFTPAASGIYNLIPSDQGRPLTDIASQLDYDGLKDDLEHVLARRTPLERRVTRRDRGAHFVMRVVPYRVSNNSVEGALVTFVDVTSIIAEEHQKLLVDELNHRVKNMLTVVISLATQTLRGAPTLDAFSEAFLGRLHGLSVAYTLLSRESWTEVSLSDVLAGGLGAYVPADRVGGGSAISFDGPAVFLRPRGALAFGMVIHEFVTNAVKYGALSEPGGRVAIRWEIVGADGVGELRLSWTEHDGPPVAEPSHRGFGRTLIERTLRHELNGAAELLYAPDGFRAALRIPLDAHIVSTTPFGRTDAP